MRLILNDASDPGNDGTWGITYWLSDETCFCPWKHGYVGVMHHRGNRLKQHRRSGRWPKGYKVMELYRSSREECLNLENELRPDREIGWNVNKGGNSMIEFTPDIRAKMASTRRGKPLSDETREKLRIASTGRTNRSRTGMPHTGESKAKISAANRGRKRSPEQCAAMSARMIGKPGRHTTPHTEETKARLSAIKKGKPIHSRAHKRALATRMKGNTYTKGRPWSPARRTRSGKVTVDKAATCGATMTTPPFSYLLPLSEQQPVVDRPSTGGVVPFTHKPGRQYGDEHRAKLSAALKGKPKSDEQKKKIAATLTGHVRTAKSRAKQSAKTKGVPKSASHKAALSVSATARYQKPGERERMSEAVKAGKAAAKARGQKAKPPGPMSQAQKDAISAGRKGKGIGNQNHKKRKPFSPEALQKMSEGSNRRWDRTKANSKLMARERRNARRRGRLRMKTAKRDRKGRLLSDRKKASAHA